MNALVPLLLASWQVTVGEALLDRLHTADLERLAVTVEADGDALVIGCTVEARRVRPAPARFLLSGRVSGLTATDGDGHPLPVALSDAGLDTLGRLAGAPPGSVPAVLTVGGAGAAGERFTFVLHYRWAPGPDGLAFASGGWFQTHLSGFWLPTMADQRFDAQVWADFPGPVCVTGERLPDEDGRAVFRTAGPVPVLCLLAGDFAVRAAERDGRRLEVWAPPGSTTVTDPDAVLDDLARVLALLTDWFGPGAPETFRLIVEPRARAVPSYCAGDFVVVHRAFLPDAAPRDRWLSLLAHECAHVWWGHRVAMPVVGQGGTWLREGLAQWAGHAAVGELLSERDGSALFLGDAERYLGTLDLRRASDGALFANEVTLLDATYLDLPLVPYLRGGLLFRLWERRLGAADFRARLKALAADRAGGTVGGEEFACRFDGAGLAGYYAATTRLPDLRVVGGEAFPGGVRIEVACDDPLWPGGAVPVLIRTPAGDEWTTVEMRAGRGTAELRGDGPVESVEVDPLRLTLDPIGSNNRWGPVRSPPSPSAASPDAPRRSGSGG